MNTSGDGFLAMFDGPQRAIRCAMAIRDAVQALGIEVRAGLHTGECEVRGDDIGGIAVHIGARVSALAGPNDVLVSSTLRDLVIGQGDSRSAALTSSGVPGELRDALLQRRGVLGIQRALHIGQPPAIPVGYHVKNGGHATRPQRAATRPDQTDPPSRRWPPRPSPPTPDAPPATANNDSNINSTIFSQPDH